MSTDGQASSGPGVPLKAPEAVDVLEVRQSRQVGGVFGIGIKVNTDPPHAVQNVSNLTDPDGTNISSLVKIGDELWAVDGIPTEQESMDVVEGLILGKKDSLVKLTLKKKETGRTEELIVKRHVAVRTWDEPLTWLELREDLLGQNFLADSGIVEVLEGIRGSVVDKAGHVKDLLKGDSERVTGLGLHLALEMSDSTLRPRQIQIIAPGSPAGRCRGLRVGDEVMAVDGLEVTGDAEVEKALRGTDVIGSSCNLRLRRGAKMFDVALQRTAASNIRSTERLVEDLDALDELLVQGVQPAVVRKSLAAVRIQVVEAESRRCRGEVELAERMHSLQASIADQVSAAEAMLHPLDHRHPPATVLKAEISDLEAELARVQSKRDEYQSQLSKVKSHMYLLEDAVQRSELAIKMLTLRAASLPTQAEFDSYRQEALLKGQESERLRATMQGMVVRDFLEAERAEKEDLKVELERVKRATAGMASRQELDQALEQVARQQATLQRKDQALATMVRKADMDAAVDQERRLRADLARLQVLVEKMVPKKELEAAEEAARAAVAAKERLSKAVLEMVPQTDLKLALQDSKLAWDQVSALKERLAGAERRAEELALKQEALVPRTQVVAAKADVRLLQEKVKALEQDIETLEESSGAFREQARALLQEKENLRKNMEGMVDREALLQARDEGRRYQEEAETSRLEAEAANNNVRSMLSKLNAAKEEVATLGMQLEGMVPREKLQQARAELVSTRSELEHALREHHAQTTQIEFSGEKNRDLRAEVEQLRAEIAEMTPRTEVMNARADVQQWREKAEGLGRELEELRGVCGRARAETVKWREEAERLELSVGGMVGKASLMTAKAEAAAAREELEVTQEEVQALRLRVGQLEECQAALAAARAKTKAAEEAVSAAVTAKSTLEAHKAALHAQVNDLKDELELQGRAGDKIAQSEHTAVQEEWRRERERREALQDDLEAARNQIKGLKDTVADWEEKAAEMVGRSELLAARREIATLREHGKAEEESRRASEEQVRVLQEQVFQLKAEQTKLRADMDAMVPRIDLVAARAAEKRAKEEASTLSNQIANFEAEKANFQAGKAKLERDVARARKELEEKTALLAKEKAKLEADLAQARKEVQDLRAEAEELRTQNDEMVPAEEWLEAQTEMEGSKAEALAAKMAQEDAERQLALLREQVKGSPSKRDLATVEDERRKASEELSTLRAQLDSLHQKLELAGLHDDKALDWLVALLSGPPRVDANQLTHLAAAARCCQGGVAAATRVLEGLTELADFSPPAVLRLLKCMRGPPVRSPAEVERLVLVLNQAPPFSPKDLELVRKILVGPPAHSPQSLEDLLAEVSSAAEAQELRERAEQRGLADSAALADLRAQMESVERERCVAPSDHAQVSSLREQLSDLKRRLVPDPPSIEPAGGRFQQGKVVVAVGSDNTHDLIYYTLDDSAPSPSNFAGKGFAPHTLSLTYSCTLQAVAQNQAGHLSGVSTAEFSVSLSPYSTTRPSSPPPLSSTRASSPPPLSSPPPDPTALGAGVGLLIEQEAARGHVIVKHVTPGGAAEREGSVRVGDRVLAVDGVSVTRMPLDAIHQLVQGPEGSAVGLSLQRQERSRGGGTISLLAAVLRRSRNPPGPDPAPLFSSRTPSIPPPTVHSSARSSSSLYTPTLAMQRAGTPPPQEDPSFLGLPNLDAPLPQASSPPEGLFDGVEKTSSRDRVSL